MIDVYENSVQVAVLLGCLAFALPKALRTRERVWTLLVLAYGSWAMGNFFWLACHVFYGAMPQITLVSDLSWYTFYIFLYMLLREVTPPEKAGERRVLPWLGVVFAVGMAVYYIQWGNAVSNLICALLMSLLLFSVIRRLLDIRMYAKQRFLFILILAFCLTEYLMWTSSCIWESNSLLAPYYWFDILLTISFPLFIPATKRAVAP